MAEFILVTAYQDGAVGLLNTDCIEAFVQHVNEITGEVVTHMKRKSEDPTRIRESLAQVTMALAGPVGRPWAAYTLPNAFGPVSVPHQVI
jgi:hypothetical protein